MFLFSIILSSSLLLSLILSLETIPHCEIPDHLSEQSNCLKCEEDHILNSSATSCLIIEKNKQLNNCLQISVYGECMRCHCSYVLDVETNLCYAAITISFLGCEISKENSSICVRPRQDFEILRSDNLEDIVSQQVQFAKGSNCEIRDSRTGQCLQCHSGYKLNKMLTNTVCNKYPNKIINEFFSYFDVYGKLQSRNYQFIAIEEDNNDTTADGVYPVIGNCLTYKSVKDKQTYFCSKCFTGKILNQSKTQCLPSPFLHCGIISDDDNNICLECEDNENFYLFTDRDSHEQKCLPRSTQDNPADVCLEFFQGSPGCKQCITGQIPTFAGCILAGIGRIQELISVDTDVIGQTHRRLIDSSCLIWEETQETNQNNHRTIRKCQICRKPMIINELGQCTLSTDLNCLIARINGGCVKCISLMFYSEALFRCAFIEDTNMCYKSSGIENTCQEYFLKGISLQNKDSINTFNGCALFRERTFECIQCFNLFFVDKLTNHCEAITYIVGCLHSDGINDVCMKCKNTFTFINNGQCQQITHPVNRLCLLPNFYYDSNSNECQEYSFKGKTFCVRYHENSNQCLECISGYFVGVKGECLIIQGCHFSDGIRNKCYLARRPKNYIDDQGIPQQTENVLCKTNQIDKICGGCTTSHGAAGIPLNENECVESSIINPEILQGCFHLTTKGQDNHFHCDLCLYRNYPDSEGICKPIKDQYCITGNGRSQTCLLCMKNTIYNEQTNICEFQTHPSQGPHFCEQWSTGDTCLKCKSLFYLEINKTCHPIDDPDCEESDGIFNNCQICKNNKNNPLKSLQPELCIPMYCEEVEDFTGNCLKCLDGFERFDYFFNIEGQNIKHQACVKMNNPYCTQVDSLLNCIECEDGYFLAYQTNQTRATCMSITIENCLKINFIFQRCLKCEEGYLLDSSGHNCWKVIGCQEFNEKCIKCEENYYLDEGFCVKIHHCQQQINTICNQCDSGYYLHFNEGIQLTFDHENSVFQQSKITPESYECTKIKNCLESNGISNSCLRCRNGFRVVKGICIRKTNDFCFLYDNFENCIQCQSLYYLEKGICSRINQVNHCQISNGIDDKCEVCSFRGYSLNTDSESCQVISDCLLSDGIANCVKCSQGYIVNTQGNCEELTINIDHCKVLSYERISYVYYLELFELYQGSFSKEIKDLFQDYLSINNTSKNTPLFMFNQVVELKKSHNKSTNALLQHHQNQQYVEELNTLDKLSEDTSPRIKCIRCQSLFALSRSLTSPCQPLIPQNTMNCLSSEGFNSICSVCQKQRVVKQDYLREREIICITGKKFVNYNNRGCSLFSRHNVCLKCLKGFYLNPNDSICYSRNPLNSCSEFNILQDTCITCMSGYTLEKNIGSDKTFCLRLDVTNQVENCQEYKPNTNICVKCVKKLKLDIVEFVINEVQNKCEDVLHLMCKKINQQKNGCEIEYIENCEEYPDNQSQQEVICRKCQNGFYLSQNHSSCLKHVNINDCHIYSQSMMDTCDICNELFFLEGQGKCTRTTHANCRVLESHRDVCLVCEERFVVDQDTGQCILSEIPHCIKMKIILGEQSHQICLKCSDDFVILENNLTTCIMRVLDRNCAVMNPQRECLKCKNNYLLTTQGECISTATHQCSAVRNCKTYDSSSTPEGLVCQSCEDNYELDLKKQCKQIQDLNQIDESDETTNSNQLDQDKNQENNRQNSSNYIKDNILVLIMSISIVVVIGGVVYIMKRILLEKQSITIIQQDVEEEQSQRQRQDVQEQQQSIQYDIQMSRFSQEYHEIDSSNGQNVIFQQKEQRQQFDYL